MQMFVSSRYRGSTITPCAFVAGPFAAGVLPRRRAEWPAIRMPGPSSRVFRAARFPLRAGRSRPLCSLACIVLAAAPPGCFPIEIPWPWPSPHSKSQSIYIEYTQNVGATLGSWNISICHRTSLASVRSENLYSSRHFEKEVEAEEEEDDVGRPASEQWRQLADTAHGAEKLGSQPIDNPDGDADGNAAESAACPHQEGEGKRQQHADGSDQRKRELAVPLHGERGHVKPRAMQIIDITAQLRPAHLNGRQDFAIEISGRLGQLRQIFHVETFVANDRTPREFTHPPGFQYPEFLRIRPGSAGSKDAPPDLEGHRIDFQNGKSAEQILRGIEQIVIVDFGVFSKDPALGLPVRLGRPAFDLIAQRVLALVCVGKKRVIEHDHACSQR